MSSSISATIINYGDATATTYMVTFAYTLTCTATTARLIVVSKPDSSSSYNKIEHQTGNTECGVYSIVFILQMAKGKKTFDEYCKKITRDDSINKCRKKLFMIKKAN